jgi:hypothetical protein
VRKFDIAAYGEIAIHGHGTGSRQSPRFVGSAEKTKINWLHCSRLWSCVRKAIVVEK